MSANDERGPWYLLTGLILGVLLGLGYAWAVQPVRYTDTNPASLRSDFKDQYRALIAASFLGNSDLVRARARLELLQDGDMYRALTEQAQRTLAENGSDNQARALGLLAIALGKQPPGPVGAVTAEQDVAADPTRPRPTAPSFAATPGEGSEDLAPTVAETDAGTREPPAPPAPTSAATTTAPSSAVLPAAEASPIAEAASATPPTGGAVTPGGPFILLSQENSCEKTLTTPLFQIEALDRFNQPLPGALVIVAWNGGQERFFTGLKPEMGPGYADFRPAPGVLYTVRIGENGTPITDLAAVACSQGAGAPVWGSLVLKFVQP